MSIRLKSNGSVIPICRKVRKVIKDDGSKRFKFNIIPWEFVNRFFFFLKDISYNSAFGDRAMRSIVDKCISNKQFSSLFRNKVVIRKRRSLRRLKWHRRSRSRSRSYYYLNVNGRKYLKPLRDRIFINRNKVSRRAILFHFFTNSIMLDSDTFSVYGNSLLIFSLKSRKLHLSLDYHGADFTESIIDKDISFYFKNRV